MLNTQELANFITSKLNEISEQKNLDYVFDVGAEVLADKNDGHIKGVLMRVANNPLVVKGFVSAKMTYRVQLAVPSSKTNKQIIQIESIIGDFVAQYEDTEQEFTNGNGSFEFTYSRPENFKVSNGVGDTVPLEFTFVVNFTDNGLLGSSKTWLLDGVEIPYLTEAVLLEKDGQTNRISDEYYNKSIMLAQSKFYKFTIVFDKENAVSTTLQADMLAGNFKKTYTLSYYDGVYYTSTAPYTTTVSIFRTADSKSDGGSLSTFEVTFADVSATELDPKYTIELFSVPFDETNVRFFDGVEEQAEWYNNLPATQRTKAEQIKAPTLNSIHTTTQVYDYDGTIFSQIQLANMNVARINEKKDTQTSSSYQLNFTQQTQYNGTITGNDGSSLEFEVVSTTPIIIDGVTYFLSVDAQGNYSLVDGGGNAITITNNQFVLSQVYFFTETAYDYRIVSSNGEVITRITKDNYINIANINLSGSYTATRYYRTSTTPIAYDEYFWMEKPQSGATTFVLKYGETPNDQNVETYTVSIGTNFSGPMKNTWTAASWSLHYDSTDNVYFLQVQYTEDNSTYISSFNFDSLPTYMDNGNVAFTGLTLVGVLDEYSVPQYEISNDEMYSEVHQRDITRSVTPYFANDYFWVETIKNITIDSETQEEVINYTYKAFISAKPYYTAGAAAWEVSELGTVFGSFNGVDLTLSSPYQITGSDGSVCNLQNPSANYYDFQFTLNDGSLTPTILPNKFYMDTTDNDPSEGNQSGYLTFYDDSYNFLNQYTTALSQSFTIDGKTYVLKIAGEGESVKILYNDMVMFDISESHQFSLDTIYQIATNNTTTTTKGEVTKGDNVYAIKTASSPYDYQFTIEGITYYIKKNQSVYDIYYSNGGDPFATNVQNGGTFTIPTSNYNYYYYTIENAELGANKQIILSLKLDTAQTYLVNQKVEFGDCFIEKAHLNRFLDNGDGTISFNNGVESPLFAREDTQNVSKRLVSRKVLKYKFQYDNAVSRWIQDNVLGWLYAFFPKENIKAIPPFSMDARNEGEVTLNQLKYRFFQNKNTLNGQFIVLCAPVYKNDKGLVLYDTVRSNENVFGNIRYTKARMYISPDYLQLFINRGGNGNVFSLKFSTKPPFDLGINLASDFVISDSGNMVGIPKSPQTKNGASMYMIKNGSLLGFTPQIGRVKGDWETILRGDESWNALPNADKYQSIEGYANIMKGLLVCQYVPPTCDLENYRLLNPIKFPKNHSNSIEKNFYTLTGSDLSTTTPQSYIVPRPGVNIEKIKVSVGYTTNVGAGSLNFEIPNKKGEYSANYGRYEVKIFDSSLSFTILQLPSNFVKWQSIDFKELVYGVVGANKNPIYNPKLLNSDYRSLKLTNERGSEFEYDIQKLNADTIQTEITEQLTPDVQRTYFRIKNSDGVYQRECSQDLTGLVETAETSLPVSTTYTKEVLASQPNYFTQRNLSMGQSAWNVAVGASIAGATKGSLAGAITGAVSGVGSLAFSLINNAISDDNMRKHSDIIKNANGNALFNLGYTTPGPTIEQYALLPAEERIINDQMFANGYNYNRIDQIRNFLHTRKYFNTIKAQLETISGIPLSKAVRDDLKMRLANGLRLWHTDNIQYNLENYELWLEEE